MPPGRDPHYRLVSPSQASQQPTTILQQLPAATSSPTPSTGPAHVKQGANLVELMMIQNAQMHQVIMNNMTMSALSSFGYSQPQLHPPSTSEEDPEVYHYQTTSLPGLPNLLAPYPHRDTIRRAVPPPPPPRATRTVGADVPPATDYYEATERRQ
ncbi:proline-rich protein 29-like [Oncorhynchus keta]|uniref:proline-rich protein 29-like n=1 Tax=Oncorhynchus keta TaxID=8018 RepID=UPI00227A076D|nr:proline-rich protein 29-like [Oncorhynchus keta]